MNMRQKRRRMGGLLWIPRRRKRPSNIKIMGKQWGQLEQISNRMEEGPPRNMMIALGGSKRGRKRRRGRGDPVLRGTLG